MSIQSPIVLNLNNSSSLKHHHFLHIKEKAKMKPIVGDLSLL